METASKRPLAFLITQILFNVTLFPLPILLILFIPLCGNSIFFRSDALFVHSLLLLPRISLCPWSSCQFCYKNKSLCSDFIKMILKWSHGHIGALIFTFLTTVICCPSNVYSGMKIKLLVCLFHSKCLGMQFVTVLHFLSQCRLAIMSCHCDTSLELIFFKFCNDVGNQRTSKSHSADMVDKPALLVSLTTY